MKLYKIHKIKEFYGVPLTLSPAACRTIADFLNDTDTAAGDYDMILTGDLGSVGSELLCELMIKQENIDISAVHAMEMPGSRYDIGNLESYEKVKAEYKGINK